MTAEAKLALIEGALAQGSTVYLCTYTQAIKITPKNAAKWASANRPIVKVSGDSLWVARGRGYDCADYCAIRTQAA